jgi:hypothetical protein
MDCKHEQKIYIEKNITKKIASTITKFIELFFEKIECHYQSSFFYN